MALEQTLGWQDIVMKVPRDWQMFFEKKTPKKQKGETGFFGFRDIKEKKMEIRWVKFKRYPQLDKAVSDYKKSLKKQKKEIKIRVDRSDEINGHEANYSYWELEKEKIKGILMVWICDESLRVIFCQSQFSDKDVSRIKPIVTEVITRMNCHPKDFSSIWTAPNLHIITPTKMKLVTKSILIGLTFFHIRNADLEIKAYRMGLADQKIIDTDITKWYKGYYREKLPGIDSRYNPGDFLKLLAGKKKIPVWKSEQALNRKFRDTKIFETYLWSNPEKNDIYSIIISLNKKPSKGIKDSIQKMINLAIKNN
ncbi:MAG: hypothetical protein ACXADA_17000 [Candidatus Hodarchaeales archaeon]|jgi:hypothetical protein